MKGRLPRLALAGLGVLVAACVPTEPEKEPRGGIAVMLLPSEATAGAPFQTNDGWTVTIEKTALRAQVGAVAQDPRFGGYGGGGGQPHVIDPRYQCELRATGLAPGLAAVYVMLQGGYLYLGSGEEITDEQVCAVDAATLRRFKTYADNVEVSPAVLAGEDVGSRPSFYVKGTAVKNGRVISFDWALGVSTSLPDFGTYDPATGVWKPAASSFDDVVNVVANQGVPARFEVHFESFFAGGLEPIASADTNDDGVVTSAELRQVKLTCTTYPFGADDSDPSTSVSQCHTLMDQLLLQAATIVGKNLVKAPK